MNRKNKNRVFILEPNLTNLVGHSLDFTENVTKLFRDKGVEVTIVVRKDVPKSLVPNAERMLSNKCFDHLETNGRTFSNHLKRLDHKYCLKENDKILIPTAYSNEIAGTNLYLNNSGVTPKFYLVIHQLYPPSDNFFKSHRLNVRRGYERKLQKLIANSNSAIKLFCTNSLLLGKTLSKNGRVECIAFPKTFTRSQIAPGKYDIVFLGDNRFEKSLHVLAEFLLWHPDKTAFIQFTPPKGYPKKYKDKLTEDLVALSKNKNITIWDNELTSQEFKQVLLGAKVIMLIYHPLSYSKRVSALFIDAIFAGKAIIATSKTWAGDIIESEQIGVTIKYDRSLENNIRSLEQAVAEVEANINMIQNNIIKLIPSFKRIIHMKSLSVRQDY